MGGEVPTTYIFPTTHTVRKWQFFCPDIPAIPGDGGIDCSALSSSPLPFYIPFFTEKATFSYTFHRTWYHFHIPTVETLHLFLVDLCKIL